MNKIILFIILFSIILPTDIKVNVKPDTIFVGSLVNIILTVENNTNDEVVLFYDLEEDVDNYTVLDKKLSQNSVEYILQFWDEGHIIIPPISIDIKGVDLDIMRIETDEIDINILTNIVNSENKLRNIKPMKELELTPLLTKILFLITLLTCGGIAIILLYTKRTPEYLKYSQGRFKTSSLQESIKQIEEVPLPENINSESTEKYYLALSKICRTFFKELFYIKATEMTSDELAQHFKLIGLESELVNSWIVVSNSADMAKYAKQIPHTDQFNVDKNNFINLIKSFHNIRNSAENYT